MMAINGEDSTGSQEHNTKWQSANILNGLMGHMIC